MIHHEVIFVLDPDFTGDLWALSRKAHVWLVGSAHNVVLARAVWDRGSDADPVLQGVTTFDTGDDRIALFHEYLGTIDEHHGELAADRPWDSIHVVGIPMNAVSADRICRELCVDAVQLQPAEAGFTIRRSVAQ